jgi:hypothetical protein
MSIWGNTPNSFEDELCFRRNNNSSITFVLINMILTFQLSTGVWKHRKATLPKLASLLWFVATVLNGINKTYVSPNSVGLDIAALSFDFLARMACITYHIYRVYGEFPKLLIHRSFFMLLPLNLVAAFCIGVYGTVMQTSTNRRDWLY